MRPDAQITTTLFYQMGGPLRAESPSYVVREADRELLEHLRTGEFCYVLSSRQTGKSSLMNRAARALQAEGWRTVVVDLTSGFDYDHPQAEGWYKTVVWTIARRLDLKPATQSWWKENRELPVEQRFAQFFPEIVLRRIREPVVVFFDEIDQTTRLPFSDGFFTTLRALFNARSSEPEYERLGFVVLGVASPAELIRHPHLTPFNVGRGIHLTDFTREEARVLLSGLRLDEAAGESFLDRVLCWTSGHPYLTHRLVGEFAKRGCQDTSPEAVDRLVQKLFLGPTARWQEVHITNIRKRLMGDPAPLRKRQLRIYRQVLKGKRVSDRPSSRSYTRLKLTGLVERRESGALASRNRIYRQAYDLKWVAKQLPRTWLRASVAVLVLIAILLVSLKLWEARIQVRTLERAAADVPIDAYRDLRDIPFHARTADRLMAGYWDRRATLAEEQKDPAAALLLGLQALSHEDTLERRFEAARHARIFQDLEATFVEREKRSIVALAPDGRAWVAVGGGEGYLWRLVGPEPASATLTQSFLGRIRVAAFSPDGRWLIAGDERGYLHIWRRTETGAMEKVHELEAHERAVSALAVSTDSERMVSGSEDRTARAWKLPELEAATTVPEGGFEHAGPITSVAISADRRYVATGQYRETQVLLWRPKKPRPAAWVDHGEVVHQLGFSADNRWLITGGVTLKLWDLGDGGSLEAPVTTLGGHEAELSALSIDSAGRRLATGGLDHTARLWRLTPESPLVSVSVLRGQGDVVRSITIDPGSGARPRLITGSEDGRVRFWRPRPSSDEARLLPGLAAVSTLAFDTEHRRLAVGRDDGSVEVWQQIASEPWVQELAKHGGSVMGVAFSRRWLASASLDGTVKLWRLGTEAALPGAPTRVLHPVDGVTALALAPGDDRVAVVTEPGEVRLWRLDGEGLETRLRDATSAALAGNASVRFSPDGRWLLAIGPEGATRLWRVGSPGEAPRSLAEEDGAVTVTAFDPRGRWLATGTALGTLELWSLEEEGRAGVPKRGHGGMVSAIGFGPAGDRLIVGGLDGQVRHWLVDEEGELADDPRDGLSKVDWPAGSDPVYAVGFSPEGGRLFVATAQWVHVYTGRPGSPGLPWGRRSWPYAIWNGRSRLLEDRMLLASLITPETVELNSVTFDPHPESSRSLEGDPAELLESWSRRLALVLEEGDSMPRARSGGR